MPPPLTTNATAPPRRPPLLKPTATGPQTKNVRKPSWLLEPKIKRFDAPNLQPSSTLPTKASLGAVRTSDLSHPSTSGRRGSVQTPTEASASTPLSASAPAPGRSAILGPGPNVNAQHQGGAPQWAEPLSPTVQDMPRPPPASLADTDAFLSDLMPPEYVALSTVTHWTYICASLQNVGTNDVRFLIRLWGFVTEFYTPQRWCRNFASSSCPCSQAVYFGPSQVN